MNIDMPRLIRLVVRGAERGQLLAHPALYSLEEQQGLSTKVIWGGLPHHHTPNQVLASSPSRQNSNHRKGLKKELFHCIGGAPDSVRRVIGPARTASIGRGLIAKFDYYAFFGSLGFTGRPVPGIVEGITPADSISM